MCQNFFVNVKGLGRIEAEYGLQCCDFLGAQGGAWILPVFCFFGAGYPMMVRSEMMDGLFVSALAASSAP